MEFWDFGFKVWALSSGKFDGFGLLAGTCRTIAQGFHDLGFQALEV